MKTYSLKTRFSGLLVLAWSGLHCSYPVELRAQYVVGPPSSVYFGGLPGDANNTLFSGPVHAGSAIYTNFDTSGSLYAEGQALTTLALNNLRLDGTMDLELGNSQVAERGGDPVVFSTRLPGFYFFDDQDQQHFEAWTREEPDPFDPQSGPIQNRIDNLQVNYIDPVSPASFESLGNFAPGSFDFRTAPTVDPLNPDAANSDINTELAIYNAADHTVVVGSAIDRSTKYREISASLDPGNYYLAIGRFSRFTDDFVQARQEFNFNPEGQVFNLELNHAPLISGGTLVRINSAVSRPKMYAFTVSLPLLGDYNADGRVDVADYTVWRDNLGAVDTVLPHGTTDDGSGFVDADDYLTWRNNYGSGSAALGLGSSSQSIPEPTGGILMLIGSAVTIPMHRWRARTIRLC